MYIEKLCRKLRLDLHMLLQGKSDNFISIDQSINSDELHKQYNFEDKCTQYIHLDIYNICDRLHSYNKDRDNQFDRPKWQDKHKVEVGIIEHKFDQFNMQMYHALAQDKQAHIIENKNPRKFPKDIMVYRFYLYFSQNTIEKQDIGVHITKYCYHQSKEEGIATHIDYLLLAHTNY